jgi:predicted Zn-dependent protease
MSKRRIAGWGVGVAAAALATVAAWWSFQDAACRNHWREAHLAFEDQDAERARFHLAPCVAWWNGRLDVRFLAARSARLAGNYDEAEEHVAFCERHGGLPDEELRRERALLQVQQGDFNGYRESLMPEGPNDPRLPPSVLEAMARGLEATSFFDQAVAMLQQLFQQDPENPRGNLLAGSIFLRKHHAAEALWYFQTAVRQLPDALVPRLRLAECLLELGQPREAATHLQALVERYPGNPEVLMAQARLAVYRAQPAEAKQVLRRLLTLKPNHVNALVALGRLEYRHGDPRDALICLNQAVEIQPYKLEAWEALAWCHAALGEPAEENRCLVEYARVGRELGEATRLALLVRQEKTDELDLRIELAERYERLHDTARAIEWRLCTLHLAPQHAATHRALADLFERTGQPHRAARHRALAKE